MGRISISYRLTRTFLRIVFSVGFLALWMPAAGQKPDEALDEGVWQREQELLGIAEIAEGERLFDTYACLALLFKDHVKELYYLDRMEQCARQLKSPRRIATALFLRLEYYSICNDTGRFLEYADHVRHFMFGHGDERSANVEALVIKRHIDEGRNQTALFAARKMLDRAAKKRTGIWKLMLI